MISIHIRCAIEPKYTAPSPFLYQWYERGTVESSEKTFEEVQERALLTNY